MEPAHVDEGECDVDQTTCIAVWDTCIDSDETFSGSSCVQNDIMLSVSDEGFVLYAQ